MGSVVVGGSAESGVGGMGSVVVGGSAESGVGGMGSVLVSGSAELGVGGVGLGRLNASTQMIVPLCFASADKKTPVNTAHKHRDAPSCKSMYIYGSQPQTLYTYM